MLLLIVHRVKAEIKTVNGVRRDSLPSYLDEFLWRERYSKDAFANLIAQITQNHPLP